MSFQSDAESLRSKLHITEIRKPVLVIACVCVLLLSFLLFQISGTLFSSNSFAVVKQEDQVSPDQEQEVAQEKIETVFVHVSGAVVKNGVLEIAKDARVVDAIEQAGGFSGNAATEALNLARPVQDGEQIIVPTREEYEQASSSVAQPGSSNSSSSTAGAVTKKININTANASELQTLSGVGEATAQKIIAYREAKGPFKTIEDLKNVSGIGDKKYADLADKICV